MMHKGTGEWSCWEMCVQTSSYSKTYNWLRIDDNLDDYLNCSSTGHRQFTVITGGKPSTKISPSSKLFVI